VINEFKNNIHKNFPFLEGKKLIVTVSGGIDSVVLTHLLHELDYHIAIAHVNFHLRGTDSDHDEEFVRQMASKLNVPYYVTNFNTKEYATQHKLSTQEAARNLRYAWFEELRQKHQFDYILTGHNLNDSLETFLINLTRGTGLKGLTGINTINGKIIRPLSNFSRDEISVFAFISNIEWHEDKSNAQTKYTRNKIRHQVIPVLQEINPNLLDSFKQTLENLQGTEVIVNDRLKNVLVSLEDKKPKIKDNVSKFPIQKLKKLNNLKAYIHELFFPYGFTNIKDIIDLLDSQSGKQVFSKTHRLVKDRDTLLLAKIEQQSDNKNQIDEFIINKNNSLFKIHHLALEIEHFNIVFRQKMRSSRNIAQFDKDLLKFPLTVRKWQNGDYFYPMGMQGKKKLSKYFKDEKLSLVDKENIWLLLSDNKIVWVIGMRQDERFKITETTNNITKITLL
jgi:tRNA(Ile)-lysidine synthase